MLVGYCKLFVCFAPLRSQGIVQTRSKSKSRTNLCIFNLPPDVDKLKREFEKIGNVTSIYENKKITNNFEKTLFIEYQTYEEAHQAKQQMNGYQQTSNCKPLFVDFSFERKSIYRTDQPLTEAKVQDYETFLDINYLTELQISMIDNEIARYEQRINMYIN
jgi:hypothetical protein